jgi:hypothetical protein
VTQVVTSTSQARHKPKPKQNSCPVAVPDAEVISRDLKYLNGIDEDLTGWTLWKRIEDGREHRFATDPAGVIRWEEWYALEPRVLI